LGTSVRPDIEPIESTIQFLLLDIQIKIIVRAIDREV
jgi:hypothetical protein